MFHLSVVLFACMSPFFGRTEGLDLDNLPKCSILDNECLRHLYKTIMSDMGKNGVPELEIPRFDSIHLENLSINVFDSVNLKVVDGYLKGVKNCDIPKFSIDIEKGVGEQTIFCEVLTFKGQYSLNGNSPLFQALAGSESITAEGKGKVKLEKVKIDFDFPLSIVKKDDGNTYIRVPYNKIKYTYNLEKATFVNEKVFLGKQDITQLANMYLNQNWRNHMDTFGKSVAKKAAGLMFKFSELFYENVPTKKYIIGDLSQYVKN